MTNYTQQIRINETRSALERTVMAAEERAKRLLAMTQCPAESAEWYLCLIGRATPEALRELSGSFGSLTGLVLAAEGVGL